MSLRVAGIYLVSAMLWIPLSDAVVARMTDDPQKLTRLQTLKGWSWIFLTSVLLYLLIQQALRSSQAAAERSLTESRQLELVLSQLPGIVWTADKNLIITSSRGGGLGTLGQETDATKGMHLGDPIPDAAQRKQVLEAALRALDGEESSYEIEFNGRRLESKMVPLRGPADEPVGVLGYARDITHEKALVARLEQSATERDKLLKHLVRAEKDERERIASGIHDDSIQVMTAAAMGLDTLIERMEEQETRAIAERSRAAMGEAITRLRTLVFDLKPIDLDRYGLAAGLRSVLEQFRAAAEFEFEVDGYVIEGLDPHMRYAMFRVGREAIVNACKHAAATAIKVRIREEDQGARVTIEDNGIGFDPATRSDGHHFGLDEMTQRSELAGGWFRLKSEVGRGTSVEFWMPLMEPDHEVAVEEMQV